MGLLVAVLAGLLFGLTMAIYLGYRRRRHSLPPWRDFIMQHDA